MSTVQSVERALDLLAAVSREPAGLVELAKRTGLPVTTASRLLSTLESKKALTRLQGGAYEIGPLMTGITSGAIATPDLQSLARLHMAQLSDHVDEAVALSVPLAKDSLTIFCLDAPKPVQAQDWTGARWPLAAGDLGLVIIATWTQAHVDEVLAKPLRRCTPQTCTDENKIRSRLITITESGVCWTTGEYVEGLSSVSSAIVDPDGRAIASLQIYGPSYRFGSNRNKASIERELLRAARSISQEVQEARY